MPRRGALTIGTCRPRIKSRLRLEFSALLCRGGIGLRRATPRDSFPRKHRGAKNAAPMQAGARSHACSTFSAATYFYPEDCERAGHFVVDVAQILECHLVCRALLSRIEMPGSRRCR
jgi:hypothetical protein